MADVKKAIDFMLHQEDAKLSAVITDAANDAGGCTRLGLCAKWHPELVRSGFFDAKKCPRDKALQIAEETYAEEYAPALRLQELSSDAVACAMLSFAVVDGTDSALELLRSALNTFGYGLPRDRAPEDDATLRAELATPDTKLVPAIVQQQRSRCEEIVAHKPTQRKWLKGWENRADKVLSLVKG